MKKERTSKDLIRVYFMTGKWFLPYCISILVTCIANPSIKLLFASAYKKAVNAMEFQQMDLFTSACKLVIFAIVIQCVIEPIANCYNGCKVNQIIYEIKKRVFLHVEQLPMSYYDTTHSADLMSRVTSDLDNFEPIYRGNTRNIMQSIVYGLGAIVSMFLLDIRLTIICIFLSMISGICNSFFSKRLQMVGDKKQEQISHLLQSFMTVFESVRITKIYPKSITFYHTFQKENALMQEIEIENRAVNSMKATLTYLLHLLSKIGILFMGLYFAVNGETDIGSVMSIVLLQDGISNMFMNLGGFVASMQGNLAGVRRIFQLLEVKKEPEHYEIEAVSSGHENAMVAFEDVCFDYDQKEILHKITFDLLKDKVYALVGTNGSGKSTLTKAMLGLYPVQGRISIMGKGFCEYDLFNIRKQIAYVDQNTALFNVSIYENIRYGRYDATREEIIKAAKQANIDEFISSLEQGYDTIVGDQGNSLSGGQRQRIILARAILKDAKIMVFDEATASLDVKNENEIIDTIKSLAKNRVIMIIAHRLQAIKEVDHILVLDHGNMVEQGTHTELMEKRGVYHMLYETQRKD